MAIPEILQMPGTRNCGAVAIANLTGVSLEDAQAVIGHNGSTNTKEIVHALRMLGGYPEDKLVPLHPTKPGLLNDGRPIPKNGIVKLSQGKGRTWHWLAIRDDKWLDGAHPTLEWPAGWKITSYLPVSL